MKKTFKQIFGEKPTFGTNPLDPWSTKAGITEEDLSENSLLQSFLKTRGIDPRFVSKNTRMAYGRSGAFKKYAVRMQNTTQAPQSPNLEEVQVQEGHQTPTYLAQKGNVPLTVITHELKMGQNIEHEHTPSDKRALAIAKDHVAEFPDYYTRLKRMEKQAEISKSARMIKAIYKKKNVVKEELYDRDAESKDPGTTVKGKSPKLQKPDGQLQGDDKSKAAAVLSGGKTMTGEPRDTIELDPMMNTRPGQPDKKDGNIEKNKQ